MAERGTLRIRIVGDDSQFQKTLGGTESKLTSFAGKLPGILGAAGALAGAGLAAGLFEAFERDAATDKLAAALNLSPEDSEAAGRLAGEVWSDAFGDNIGEVNTAIGAVVSSIGGFDTLGEEAVGDLTRGALTLADVFDQDVSQAAMVAGQMMRDGLAADGEEALDLLTRGFQEMPQSIRGELLEATTEYGKFFSALGFSGDEAFGVLTTAAEDGMYGIDKAGDSIKEFSDRATDMSKATVDAFDTIGLDAETMAGRILEGGETARGAFDDIIEGLLSIEDPVAQSAAAVALFGDPIKDLTLQEIPEFLESLGSMENRLGDVEGATDRVADAAYDNLRAKWTSAWRSAQTVFLTFADEEIIPAVDRIMEAFEEDGLEGAMEQVRVEWDRAWPQIERWLNDTVQPAIVDFGTRAGKALAEALWEATKAGVTASFRNLPGKIADAAGDFFTSPSINFHNSSAGREARSPRTSVNNDFNRRNSIVMHEGGIVPGMRGQEVPAILEAGERVVPADEVRNPKPSGMTFQVTQNLYGSDRRIAEDSVMALKKFAITAAY